MKLKNIKDQVVVVFGASSGIGRETAKRFAARGAKVVVSARSKEGLLSLIEEITRDGGEATAVPAEVTSFAGVQAVAGAAIERYGALDTWVHLAAVSVYAPFTDTTPEEFARVIEVNQIGQAYGAMAALPYMREKGGALIHVSSVEAVRPLPFHSAYASSKHGVHGFVETLRMELKHDRVPVSVTEVMPASINTPFFNKARTKIGVKPMGLPPFYEPGIVADAILYAAQHPVREMVVGGAGKAMVLSQRAAPRLTDGLLTAIGFKGQETKEPKPAAAPDSMFAPIPGYDRAEGDFADQAKSRSIDTWFGTHPAARRLVLGAALGGAAWLALRGRRGGNGIDGAGKTDGVADRVVVIEEVVEVAPDVVPPPDVATSMPAGA